MEFFLASDGKTHLKGVARALGISPHTAQLYLQSYEKDGLLEKERMGNLTLYGLARNSLTSELKRLNILARMQPFAARFMGENHGVSSLVLYGSHASGEYDSKSDLDILIIYAGKEPKMKVLLELEPQLSKEVKIQALTLAAWKAMEEKNNKFYNSVIRRHITIFGASL